MTKRNHLGWIGTPKTFSSGARRGRVTWRASLLVIAGVAALLMAFPFPTGCSDDSGGGNQNGNTNDNGNANGNGNQDCEPTGPEVPDNDVDEDCDGYLGTSVDVPIRAAHPRVIVDPGTLQGALTRMVGDQAVEPYSTWFAALKESEDSGEQVDLANLALLYLGTGDGAYLDAFIERIPQEGDPTLTELAGIDLLFDRLPDETKQLVMDRVAANPDVWYWNAINQSNGDEANWGYHSAIGVARALAYAGIFALTPLEMDKDPERNPFNCLNYLKLVAEELSEQGRFRRIERRIAGDPTYNDALPGDFGGMYDNIGYDSAEESFSINVIAEWRFLTGQDVTQEFLHDRYRGRFYQNMQYPHLFRHFDDDQWCRRAGTEYHIEARIWDTQTDWINQPRTDAVALTAWLYQDEKMQYYAHNGVQRILCGEPYNGMYWDLLFYDADLGDSPPSDNPTAMYFNGPGLVTMREDWSNEAVFGVFIAGEGISRRYEDANSFLIHRKVNVFPHAGARIRHNEDNDRHHWYAIRSISKNTIKVFDPDECLDLDESNNRGPLHSGTPLVDSDNMGGQMFETRISTQDGQYVISGEGEPGRMSNPNDPLGLYETANVIKYEHVEGDYTYAVGDGAAAYTMKIEYYEREFVYLRPDSFVIFDRVRSPDPSFKKVWVVHTVDEPTVAREPDERAQGMRAWDDATQILVHNPLNDTQVVSLLPAHNRVVVRGGDTVLATGLMLSASSSVGTGQVADLEIPRWVEVFAVGSDTEGSITITGDALEGQGVSEVITFDGAEQTPVSSRPTEALAADHLTDDGQHWQAGQFAGFMVRIHVANDVYETVISDNDEHHLYADFQAYDGQSAWGYQVYRPVANTYNHYTRITSITTDDMDVDSLTLSVPHYFDAMDASGRLHSFSPHTDGRDDQYHKRTDFGQWTLEIEATAPSNLDNFLNVITLRDPGAAMPDPILVEGSNVAGVVIEGRLLLFAKEPGAIEELSVELPSPPPTSVLVFDLTPDQTYYVSVEGATLSISTSDNGGSSSTSSAMGVLAASL